MATNLEYEIKCFADKDVDEALDKKLRELLHIGFPHYLFDKHRYTRQIPAYRWCLFTKNQELVAHLDVYERLLGHAGGDIPVAGIGEVCVHPQHRKQGLMKKLFAAMHTWAKEGNYHFTMLFGKPEIYSGLGYKAIDNPIRSYDLPNQKVIVESLDTALVRGASDSNRLFPGGEIDFKGIRF